MYENLEGRGSSSNPADLNITVQPDLNKNYFTVTIPGLKINTDYAFNFQWIYPDGTVSSQSVKPGIDPQVWFQQNLTNAYAAAIKAGTTSAEQSNVDKYNQLAAEIGRAHV